VDSVGEELERLARLRASGDLTDAEYELLKTQLIHRERDAARSEKSDRTRSQVPGWFTKKERSVHTTLSLEIWDSIRNSVDPNPRYGRYRELETRIGQFPVELASSPSDMARRVRDWEVTDGQPPPAMTGGICQGNKTNHISLHLYDKAGAEITVVLVPADHPRLNEVSQKQKSIVQAVKEQYDGYQTGGYLVPSHPDWEGHWCFIGSVEYTAKHARYIEVKIGPSSEDVLCIGRAPNRWQGSTSSIQKAKKVRDKGPSPRVVLTALEELRRKTWSN
jgi:hypothetical protein